MLRVFRYVALVEGVTTLALFLIAVPLKYALGNPILVPPVGMAHGIAFLFYLVAMLACLPGSGIGALGWLRTFFAAFIPFGTFLNDAYIRQCEATRVSAAS